MGNSFSGEGLDTVSLWCEVKKVFSKVGIMKKAEFGLVDYMRYKVSNFLENNKFLSQLKLFFKKLQDDTCAPVAIAIKEFEGFVREFGRVYPKEIPFNIGISCMGAKFLDVMFHRTFSDPRVKTNVARNFNQPPRFLNKKSMVPNGYKMCVVHSEVIRYMRICSEKVYFEKNLHCLFEVS